MCRILFVFLFVSFVSGQSGRPKYALQACESAIGKVINASVTGTKFINGRYILKRGTEAGIHIDFIPNVKVNSVNAVVHGIINGLPIPFPLPNPNGCTTLPCPLSQGVNYNYIRNLPVSPVYPKIAVDVKWELKNENDEVIACLMIPARID